MIFFVSLQEVVGSALDHPEIQAHDIFVFL